MNPPAIRRLPGTGPLLAWSALLALALLWPAAWNGMPLLFSDSLDYLDTARDPGTARIRPPLYGLLILPLVPLGGSWAIAPAQALALALPLLLLVRRLSPHPAAIPLAVLATAGLSTAPFFASWILPDALAALVVLAAIHAVLAETRRGAVAWAGIAALAAGTHATYPPLLAGLGLGLVALATGLLARPRRLLPALLLIAAGATAPLPNIAHNAWHHGQPRAALGADGFLAGRMAGDGLLQAHLARTCPDAVHPHPLCAAREQIPRDSDLFLWTATGPFWLLRGFDAPPEIWADLNRAALREGWPDWIAASLGRALRQAVAVGAGDGPTHGPDFYRQVAAFAPPLLPGEEAAILGARAGQEAWGTWGAGPAAAPEIVGGALVLCLLAVVRRPRRETVLALLLLLAALAGNALLVGLGGAVHDRYQARIAWLLPALAGPLLLVSRRRGCPRPTSSGAPAPTSPPAADGAGASSAAGTGAPSARTAPSSS